MQLNRYQRTRELLLEQNVEQTSWPRPIITPPGVRPGALSVQGIRGANRSVETPLIILEYYDLEAPPELLLHLVPPGIEFPAWLNLPPFPNGGAGPLMPFEDAFREPSQGSSYHTPEPSSASETDGTDSDQASEVDTKEPGENSGDGLSETSDGADNEFDVDAFITLNEEQSSAEGVAPITWRPANPLPDFNQLWVSDIERMRSQLRIFPDGRMMLNFETGSPLWGFRLELAQFIRNRSINENELASSDFLLKQLLSPTGVEEVNSTLYLIVFKESIALPYPLKLRTSRNNLTVSFVHQWRN
ncbi:hypothetical protein D8B26_008207 [Coccidioides posadasii str. Silveira]|uniref:uncharacterized protein n=1 Tax=Coccidioides posadasii (strain RMSCC 757 / Silveira) TaxID=443226 RepID=UPI001BF06310|nr:hypothetical protein D8B26_008207 [Coccidioides posadasii str. Silveira]